MLHRPKFLAIVSSNTLATTMLRRANGRVDGFVIETPTAGGHNAPPRGKLQLNAAGEPVYGERDQVNIAEMRAWAFRSGWRAAMATRRSCARPWSRARRASRWAPLLRSAGSPACAPT